MKTVLTTLGISLLVLAGCAGQKQAESNFIQENIDNACLLYTSDAADE